MRHTRIDQTEQIVFCLYLIIQNCMGDIYDLKYFHSFVVSFHFTAFYLYVPIPIIILHFVRILLLIGRVLLQHKVHLAGHHAVVMRVKYRVVYLILIKIQNIHQTQLRLAHFLL